MTTTSPSKPEPGPLLVVAMISGSRNVRELADPVVSLREHIEQATHLSDERFLRLVCASTATSLRAVRHRVRLSPVPCAAVVAVICVVPGNAISAWDKRQGKVGVELKSARSTTDTLRNGVVIHRISFQAKRVDTPRYTPNR